MIDDFEAGEWPTGGEQDDSGGPSVEAGRTDRHACATARTDAPHPRPAIVNKPEQKVGAVKLGRERAVFADDMEMPGMLYGGLLTSPHAHARIVSIDASRARALPGVHAVLTHEDVPRVIYASGGQSYPNPHPYDQVILDNTVRHVGDRVAIIAAETTELVQLALELIDVQYEALPAVLDPLEAMAEGAPVIHDEADAVGIHDAAHNVAVNIHVDYGDVDQALAGAHVVHESEYRVHQVQQGSIEPHVVLTWWDEDDRLVIRTSTQVPFHVRRMVAPLIGLPVRRIRVVKPRIGGGFGGKQEMLLEDLCAHLTLATGRPVRFEYTRQEFQRTHAPPQILRQRRRQGRQAGRHRPAHRRYEGLRHARADGADGLRLPQAGHLLAAGGGFDCQVVYTNKPVPGVCGYGAASPVWAGIAYGGAGGAHRHGSGGVQAA